MQSGVMLKRVDEIVPGAMPPGAIQKVVMVTLNVERVMNEDARDNVDEAEVSKFEALARRWWDKSGEFKPLHDINPLRAGYIGSRVELAGKRVLDVGCGGGILTEALAQAGALVTGIDAGAKPLEVARLHSLESGLDIDYRHTTVEALAAGHGLGAGADTGVNASNDIGDGKPNAAAAGAGSDAGVNAGNDIGDGKPNATAAGAGNDAGKQAGGASQAPAGKFDVITCLEMLEHVPDPGSVIHACRQLLADDGHLFLSTINRNPKSWLFAIVGAEYVLNLLPRGTHSYDKLIKPAEIAAACRAAGLEVLNLTGMTYNPITRVYRLSQDIDVNYLAWARPA